jgi:broad-specificity NMP kinase
MSMDQFRENIREWVALDNRQKDVYNNLRDIRDKKKKISSNINTHISSNNLQNSIVKISDGKIKFATTKVNKPLTLQYISSCLEKTIDNKNTVDYIMNIIKTNRDCNYVDELKRYYDN